MRKDDWRTKNKKTGAERTEKGHIKRMKESRMHSVLSVTLISMWYIQYSVL